jgi:CBS domain-containing protein
MEPETSEPVEFTIPGPPADRRLTALVRPIVWCDATERISDVARRISDCAASFALVRTTADIGIVTDHDFRDRVATGEVSVDAPVGALATTPVLTIDEDATQSAGLLRMVEHAVHHLVVTDRKGSAVGVVRAVDLAGAEVRDPLVVRAAVESATSLTEVAAAARRLPDAVVALVEGGFAPTYVGAVHAAVVDAIVRRVLRLRTDPVLAQVRHSWVVLGSLARRESLPLSDVDTALVWADPPPSDTDPAGAMRTAAAGVIADLRRCGLEPCTSGTNADNPAFSRSRGAWAAAIAAWHASTDPHALLMTSMVADSRPVTSPDLGAVLTSLTGIDAHNTRFLRGLLDEALRFRPPTGFVRDFVVEHGGTHSGELDLKKGGLAPVAGLARWVALASGDVRGNTAQRLRRGAELGLLTGDEAQTLTGIFEYVYALVMRHETAAMKEGREPSTFIAPAALDTLTRRHLREAFRLTRSVQSHLDENWLARLERASPIA